MLNTLKKYTKRNNILLIAVGIIAIVLCFVFTKFAVFDLIRGPQTIDLTADPSQYEGKWVKLDVDYIITDYVEHYTEVQAVLRTETVLSASMRSMILSI